MQEIRCPKCGEVFQVDETGYDQIARQVRDKEFIKEIERRERELAEKEKEYRAEKASTIGILVDRIGKVIPKIFPQVAVAGMPGEEVPVPASVAKQPQHNEEAIEIATVENDEQDEATAELESLLERFAAVEPEWLPLLRRMVEMAEAKDATYNMARNFLLSK